MAINEDVPGLEAVVHCQDRRMTELEDPNANEADDAEDAAICPVTTKYIECVDGAEFDVTILVHENYLWGFRDHVITANVYVDGTYTSGVVIRNNVGTRRHTFHGTDTCSATHGGWYRRRFKFAPVKTIDDARKERVESDLKLAKGLGTIEVKFRREIEYGVIRSTGVADSGTKKWELAEKSLKGKAVSHGTSYGKPETIAAPTYIQTRPIHEDHGPILRIIFRYRSRDALKRELIIPRSPSLSPTLENLTEAERDRLAAERLSQLRSQDKIKREGSRSLIKREFSEFVDLTDNPDSARPSKKSRQGGKVPEIVDLTDD
ncbi:hypothetical protein F4861DRAFT_495654 [Xylaria intraflava]|nr:hypothetical protein F4861DRAFT_495654 [Xylaria intraflava]